MCSPYERRQMACSVMNLQGEAVPGVKSVPMIVRPIHKLGLSLGTFLDGQGTVLVTVYLCRSLSNRSTASR